MSERKLIIEAGEDHLDVALRYLHGDGPPLPEPDDDPERRSYRSSCTVCGFDSGDIPGVERERVRWALGHRSRCPNP